ncbi:MAG: cobalamin-binding protein [Alphaproteobacteria bacterium]|nr:cobalamin-binding protein [Alphaproteobacteria bacterium]
MTELRIISLLPSATEIVCALGFAGNLVGRSHECDFPASAGDLPVCSSSKLPAEGTSAAIDNQVKDIVERGLSIYRIDAERLRDLAPDVIVTQDQCEVCAVSLQDVEHAVGAWTGAAPAIVSLSPSTLEDVWETITNVAGALDAQARGSALIARLASRMAEIEKRAAELAERPRLATIEWIEPLMAAGNWMPQLIEMAGGENLFGEAGRHSPWLDWPVLRQADPDIILVMPCGFDLERAGAGLADLERLDGWPNLRAVGTGRITITDGNQYFNRPGPRLVQSLEILAEIIHPEAFDFGHRGSGWIAAATRQAEQ